MMVGSARPSDPGDTSSPLYMRVNSLPPSTIYCRSKSLVDELRPELPERSKKAQASLAVLSVVVPLDGVLVGATGRRTVGVNHSCPGPQEGPGKPLCLVTLCKCCRSRGGANSRRCFTLERPCPALRIRLAGRSQALTRCIACPCLRCAGALLRVPGLVRRRLHPLLR